MSRSNRSPRQVVTVVLVLLAVTATLPAAAAQPSIYLSNARVSDTTVAVGETVTVTGVAENLGSDSGGYTMTFTRNGSSFASKRVVVAAGEKVAVTRNLSFDAAGTYEIVINDRSAGTVRVTRATATETADTDDRHAVTVRAGDVPVDEPYRLAFPETNRTVAVENWTVEASQRQFVQDVVAYDRPESANVTVPAEAATVLGVITVGSTEGVDAVTMRVRVDRSRLRAAELDATAVGLYHRNGSSWEPLNTTVAQRRADSVVLEARADSFSTFAVGRIEPQFEITNASFDSVDSTAGQRIVVDGTIRNDGAVAGAYEARMLVNGEQVNATAVTVPADGSRSVTLWHDVTEPDTYRVRLNDRDLGSLIVTGSQVRNGTGSDNGTSTAARETTAQQTTVAPPGGADVLPEGVPSTVLGVDTLYLVGGVAAALVAFLALVALLRRGGSGPGGDAGGGGGTDGFERL